MLYDFNLAFKACEALLFPIHRSFIVDVHCCGNIGMTHDFLNDLDVSFVLTEPRAECVSELVYGETRDQYRLSLFFLCCFCFLLVVVADNAFYRPIDIVG